MKSVPNPAIGLATALGTFKKFNKPTITLLNNNVITTHKVSLKKSLLKTGASMEKSITTLYTSITIHSHSTFL